MVIGATVGVLIIVSAIGTSVVVAIRPALGGTPAKIVPAVSLRVVAGGGVAGRAFAACAFGHLRLQ